MLPAVSTASRFAVYKPRYWIPAFAGMTVWGLRHPDENRGPVHKIPISIFRGRGKKLDPDFRRGGEAEIQKP